MFAPWLPESGGFAHPMIVLALAMIIDALVGDPSWLYRKLPHPAAAIGSLITAGERVLYGRGETPTARFWRGAALAGVVIGVAAAAGWGLGRLTNMISGGWLIEAVLASSLIAYRSLYDHVRAVADDLEQGLDAGREAVRHIVGRDPASLDEAGVARAAIESTAENFADGVVAPVFWFALLGLPGLAAYKAVNTLDSMIGHRNDRYDSFGKAAARIDDAANWIPARIAGLLIAAAGGGQAGAAWRTMRRDARRHRSVNAGWAEAPMAGALGLSLAGPRRYGDVTVEDHWMGSGRKTATSSDIRRVLGIYRLAWLILAALVCAAALPPLAAMA